MAKLPRTEKVTVELTRAEALALIKVADTGLRVIEALGLVANPGTARQAVDKIETSLSR